MRLSLAAWVAAWAFWLIVTRDHHPTLTLALIVTTSLIVAYATAAYLNHLVLIPRLWRTGHRGRYIASLLAAMCSLTAVALLIIRVSYHHLFMPDTDPYGTEKHFAIDLFGMAVHLVLAAIAVWGYKRMTSNAEQKEMAN